MSFLPAKQNFKVFVGGTWHYRFLWDIEENGVAHPRNLTNFEATMTIKSLDGLHTYQILTNQNDGVVLGGTTGIIDLILSSEQTEELGWTAANYKLFVHDIETLEDIPLLWGRLNAIG